MTSKIKGSNNLNCPNCHQIDKVEKVSSIYNAGVSSGRTVGSIKIHKYRGKQKMSGTTQTLLSRKLAPPALNPPALINRRQKTRSDGSIGCMALFLFVVAMLLTPLGVIEKILAIIGFLIVQHFLTSSTQATNASQLRTAQLAQQKQQKVDSWQKATNLWNELYYCYRCDIVFDPRSGYFTPCERMTDWLNNQAPNSSSFNP